MATAKTRQKVLKTFLTFLSNKGYQDVSLPLIAETADVKLSDLRGAYASKLDLVRAFAEQIDKSVLDGRDDDMDDQPARDRLFDILMSRIDALAEHKDAVRSLHEAAKHDPGLALDFNRIEVRSQKWMLIAADIELSGMKAEFVAQALVVAFSRVVETWLNEKDEGMPRTMAKLDKQLDKGTSLMKRLNRLDGIAKGIRSVVRAASGKGRRRSGDMDDTYASDLHDEEAQVNANA
ncbi:MAG: TetR/AcrR family transcriptional regulator [Roseibium sp.]